MPRTIRDLQQLTGRSRETIIAAIESGQCPGYKLGNGYSIPDEAFDLFARGYWEPQPARITPIQPQVPLVRSVRKPEPSS